MASDTIRRGSKRRAGEAKAPEAKQRIGWRGVSLEVPEDWSLTSVSGEGVNGYLRVESPETLFLQVKWWDRRGIVSTPDALENYIRDLERRARGSRVAALGAAIRRAESRERRASLEWKRGPRSLAGIRPSEQAPVTYSWTGGQRAYGVVYHCGECKRLVIAEVVGRLEDDFSGAAAILRSIREHPADGWNPWGMYGLYVELPKVFQLEKHQLMTGYLRFAFRHRARTFLVQRWGLANVALRGSDLKEWYDYQERDRLARYRYRYEPMEIHGHEGLRLFGREKLLPGAAKGLHQLTSFSAPALRIEGRVWLCPEGNKIYAITAQHGRDDGTLDEVVRRLRCHE
jgi:hypothetical protein